jgi:hydrophobic/amphiphilic exporter-1 (mainly G- bacteria), HAE1 family
MKVLDLPHARPVAIVILFSLLAFLGIVEYSRMKYELTPPMTMPYLMIQTIYPGASPMEVEDSVSKKMEDAISGTAGIKHITSQSMENYSIVAIEFAAGTDVDIAAQDVQRAINANAYKLPSEVKTPSVNKFSMDDLPIIQLAISAKLDKGPFYDFVNDEVKSRLSRINGVGQVSVVGGNARQVGISLSQTKLEQYGIPILLVLQKLKAANLDFPAGTIKDADGEYVVRIAGKLKSLDEIRGLVLMSLPGSGNIRLGDVAQVQDVLAESTTIFRYDGKDTIGVTIMKQSGANAVEVSKSVHAEVDKIKAQYKDYGVGFVYAEDTSVFTLGSAHDVIVDIILAILFVGIIILLFLHDIRNAFIVMMAIPATLLSTFIGIGQSNFTLNMMSLLALTLVIGILVDDSIVVVENIHRHKAQGSSPLEAARGGTREIAFAATSVTLVIIVAFLPVSLSGGMIGALLIQFGLTLVIATAISLVVSFFLTPLLASKLGEHSKEGSGTLMDRFGSRFDGVFAKVTAGFQSVLDWAVKRKKLTILLAVGIFVGSLALMATGLVGAEFVPSVDRGELSVNIVLPERITLEENDRIVRGIEGSLLARPDVERVYAKIGYTQEGAINNKSEIDVGLVPKASRAKSSTQVGVEIEAAVKAIPGVKVTVVQGGLMGSGSDPISYYITGPDHDANAAAAKRWAAMMRGVPGTGEINISEGEGKPELRIDIDRNKMADLGLSLDMVGAALRTALAGNEDLSYQEGGVDYTIRIVLDSFDRTSTAQVAKLSFPNDQGRQISLGQFAAIKNGFGPTVLMRYDRVNAVTVSSPAIGRTAGEVHADIMKAGAALNLPKEVSVLPTGMLAFQSEAFGSMGFAMILSFIFIYAILAVLFNSFLYPLAVIACLPFAMIGGFFALAVTRQSLNIFSILALILLLGLTAKNAILLVDRALKNRGARGMSPVAAFKEAVSTRIRPIFMTTLAMVFGMLPVAFGLGSAGEMKSAMGIVLIGGLVFGMLVTMVIVPVTFLAVENLKIRFSRPSRATLEKNDALNQ